MSDKRVIVVGGGLAGLASAVELASNGFDVTIVERNTHLGGKMNVLRESGYTFDMGPTILTLPQVLCGIIERTGGRVDDYITLVNLDPQWRCFYEDGKVIDLWQDVPRMARTLDAAFPGTGAGEGYAKFIAYSRRMLKLSEKVFFFKDLGGVGDVMRNPPPKEPGLLGDVLAMRMHSTVAATAHGMIREPHVRQLVEHFLQYVGSSPFLAPSILSLIAAAQSDYGCYYSMGGTRAVARALERLCHELNVKTELGVGVGRINTQGGRVTGVTLDDGRVLSAGRVVSNCDVQRTYRDLVGDAAGAAEQRDIERKYTPACSGVVFYFGLDKQYDHLLHHNFMFSRSSDDEFNELYRRGVPPKDPTLYIAAPSRTDDTQAPPGGEALYVLIHTPYLRPGVDWHGKGGVLETYRPIVVEKMKRMGMPDLESRIVVERHLTPNMIDRMYNAEGGAIYGLASHGRLKGGFKPRNRSRVVDGLYLTGGSANPGPGVPMVLMSGVTAAWALCEDAGVSPRGGDRPVAKPVAPTRIGVRA
jgi:diapolycopene oxygenase